MAKMRWRTLLHVLPADWRAALYSGVISGEIDLVICDGPPSSIRGGRYGLLPVCANSLSHGCLILMDDGSPGRTAQVQRWSQEFEFEVLEMHDYGVLRMRQPARIR